MKISVKKLGTLEEAEFGLGELTLICGGNNTGKTYATYALFGFLKNWERSLQVRIPNETVAALLKDGITRIDVDPYIMKAQRTLSQGCIKYTQGLPRIFASKSSSFKDTKFQVYLEPAEISSIKNRPFERQKGSAEVDLFSFFKGKREKELEVSLLIDRKGTTVFSSRRIKKIISDVIVEFLFEQFFPRTFIASAERTGAAIFRKELNFARNRMLEEMSRTDNSDFDPIDFLINYYHDYPMPVKTNVDFIRGLETISKEDSFLLEKHPQVLDDFADIIGGKYIAGSSDTIYFNPAGTQLKLTMNESSSGVRSLLDIGFYLRHVAKPGDLLMIDEPELNLHPENQCRMARLFARLVNLGIRVFATTHSDYIVKELNTLIMLNQDKPHLKLIAREEGYHTEEFISAEKVRVYISEEELTELDRKNKSGQHYTFVPAKINSEFGIEARSFDETINKMNAIQESIVWGKEE